MSIKSDDDGLKSLVDIKLSYKNQVKKLTELLYRSYGLHQHIMNILQQNPEVVRLFNIESKIYEEYTKKNTISRLMTTNKS